MTVMVLSETFRTLQGEGPSVGRPAVFIRTAGCNLSCGPCDTAYTWDWKGTSEMARERGGPFVFADEHRRVDVQALASEVAPWFRDVPTSMLVFSGGEPMTQQAALVNTIAALSAMKIDPWVEVETNGTQAPRSKQMADHVDRFVVSPKVAGPMATDTATSRIVPSAIRELRDTGKATWKFVAGSPDDLAPVEEFIGVHQLDGEPVWLMPEGRTAAGLDRATRRQLAVAARDRGWCFTDRLHIRLWGDTRGT